MDLGDGEIVALDQVVTARRCLGDGAGCMVDLIGTQQAFDLAVSADRGAGRAHDAFLRPIQRVQQIYGIGLALIGGSHHISQGGHGCAGEYRFLRERCDRHLQQFVQCSSASVVDLGI